VRRGRVAESGTLAELRHLTRTVVSAELERLPEAFDAFEGLHEVRVTQLGSGAGGGVRLECTVDTEHLSDLMVMLGTEGIRSLTTRPPTLEELFLRHYADPERGVPGDVPIKEGEPSAA
jgi:ABC-2 type transport system ATP-binding protein